MVPGEGNPEAAVMFVGDPRAPEVAHWMPFLERELALIRPRLVVPLGGSELALAAALCAVALLPFADRRGVGSR